MLALTISQTNYILLVYDVKSTHDFQYLCINFVRYRPIAKLSNRAFAWHENEAYYAKVLFFLFHFSEFQNASLRVLQQF